MGPERGTYSPIGGEAEIRRDRAFSHADCCFRVYLDNYDQLKKVDSNLAAILEGTADESVLALRQEYSQHGLPRHPKKAVANQGLAEVQGAMVNGRAGRVFPKPAKVMQYLALALQLLEQGEATKKQLQVVGGGYVYFSMFRRPLLGALNVIWRQIVLLDKLPQTARVPISNDLRVELTRFMGLVGLAQLNLRTPYSCHVTASDASSTGGGITVTHGLTGYRQVCSHSTVRGEVQEQHEFVEVLTVGLFDGIGALRVAADACQLPVAGHISCDVSAAGRRVVENHFPNTVFVEDVELIDESMVKSWACQFGFMGLVVLGAGPPCQGVSGLNYHRRGALRDERSRLFWHVPRIEALLRACFPWAQVHVLMESVASMDLSDLHTMSEAINRQGYRIDAAGISLSRRPRIYWVTWELNGSEFASVEKPVDEAWSTTGQVTLTCQLNPKHYLEPGWKMQGEKLPTFTTSRPQTAPGARPAGLQHCDRASRRRWEENSYCFPPYQYKAENCLANRQGELRTPSIIEREACLGFPIHYTAACRPKSNRQDAAYTDDRLTLLGNTWNVSVVAWLLSQLGSVLGICNDLTPQAICEATRPGGSSKLQGLLFRPPLGPIRGGAGNPSEHRLVKKLCGLTSMKGEDLLLQAPTDPVVKSQRLRVSIPGGMWRWKDVTGWLWHGDPEHINALELRAVLTTLRWRVLKQSNRGMRLLHLIDSLVCLHALTRGRSSSRKLRRILCKINALLLAYNLHPTWGYINTKLNPADRPSRRGVRRKWK